MSEYNYSTSSDIINNSIVNEVYMNMQEHFTPTVAKAITKNVQSKLQSKNKTTSNKNTPKKQSTPNKNTPKRQLTPKKQPNKQPKRQPNKQPKKQLNNQIKKQSKKQSKKNVMSKTIPKSNIKVPVVKQSPKPPRVQPTRVQPPKVQPPRVQSPKVQPPRVQSPKVQLPRAQPPRVQPPKQPKINTNANLQITPVKPKLLTIPKRKEKFSQNPINNPIKNTKIRGPAIPFVPPIPINTSDATQQINNLSTNNTLTTTIQSTTVPETSNNITSNVPKENIPTNLPKDEIQENILNLNIQKLVTLSLKAMMDTIADLSMLYNSNKITIMNVLSIVLKDNRIMYLGTGFFMVSVAMYIFNNFLRIPSFGFGGIGERRVFINNY